LRHSQADGDLKASLSVLILQDKTFLSPQLIQETQMRFQRIEFSWRAAFVGLYLTPERDKLWITIVPFLPLYFKKT
jgi:hypothetical protein